MTELALPPGELSRHRRPRVGYAMTIVAATMFAVNGAVAKIGLEASDMGTLRWTELRSTGGFIGLALGLALVAPQRLRIGTRRELGWLAFYGVVGFAVVQWLYFVAIERLPIGIGLLFEFSAPVLIANTVMNENSDGRRACLNSTERRETPLLRAMRMKSSWSVVIR